ncbi:MAG TPA: P-II family nitrogen regulator [Spirochaetia bacterium]|nr:P-II family nitrogen regulator [Spirochaetia bacterium]
MKLIIAIVQPNKVEDIKNALTEVGISRLTVVDVEGYGKQKGHVEVFRGREYEIVFTRKIQLEVLVKDEKEKETAINAIVSAARTGNIGDGKIIVLPVEEAVRIRTGEKNEDAV